MAHGLKGKALGSFGSDVVLCDWLTNFKNELELYKCQVTG
jgi:hypothetical protein